MRAPTIIRWFTLGLGLAPVLATAAGSFVPSALTAPQPPREFRGVWIATVANIDWPSRPGLSTADQKRELAALLDRAVALRFNAVIFQVRPACDALYASRLEPWSECLTGRMGKPPEPFYDPLAFAIAEAHRRGLELHAWFNPYRALHFSSKSAPAPNHISKTQPALVRQYGKYLWLDPGEPRVVDHTLNVVMDVVTRYDIDGVQFDDYFYPDLGDAGAAVDFPDLESFKRHGAPRGLARDDWRRDNVNRLIQRVYESIKTAKPWIKFGISPFGIWRPGHPPPVTGKDVYAKHYADSRLWLANGWVDYLAPQLYWPIEPKEQSFPLLLQWWAEQNRKHRHLWPGVSTANARRWGPDEIPNQIGLTRKQPGVTGYLCFSMGSLAQTGLLAATFEQTLNRQVAVPPASPWLAGGAPGKPRVHVSHARGAWQIAWNARGTNAVRWWLVQTRSGGEWSAKILPAETGGRTVSKPPEAVAITAFDRTGRSSAPAVLEWRGTGK